MNYIKKQKFYMRKGGRKIKKNKLRQMKQYEWTDGDFESTTSRLKFYAFYTKLGIMDNNDDNDRRKVTYEVP